MSSQNSLIPRNMESKQDRLRREEEIVKAFNQRFGSNCCRSKLTIGSKKHEFDLYEQGKFVGGVTMSPYYVGARGNTNTGAIDRALAEVLWLLLYAGKEDRVLIFTDSKLAQHVVQRVKGTGVWKKIRVLYCDESRKTFRDIDVL